MPPPTLPRLTPLPTSPRTLQPPLARPNTPTDVAAVFRRWQAHGLEPSEREIQRYAERRTPIGADVPAGAWAYSKDVLNAQLWRLFKNRQIRWSLTGQVKIKKELASIAVAAKAELDAARNGQSARQQANARSVVSSLDPGENESINTLAKFLNADPKFVARFAADIGLSALPLLGSLTSALKLGGAVAGAVKQHLRIGKAERLRLAVNGPTPVFDLARQSLLQILTKNRKMQLVNVASYTFDLVISLVPVAWPIASLKVVADLGHRVEMLYHTWLTVHELNAFLVNKAGDAQPDVVGRILDHPILGCYLFAVHDEILSGRFSDLDVRRFSRPEQQQILRLLGADAASIKDNAARLEEARQMATDITEALPFTFALDVPAIGLGAAR